MIQNREMERERERGQHECSNLLFKHKNTQSIDIAKLTHPHHLFRYCRDYIRYKHIHFLNIYE